MSRPRFEASAICVVDAYHVSRTALILTKELTMKRFTSFKHAVFATLLLSTTLTAFASGGGSAAPRDYPFQNANSSAGQRTTSTASGAAVLPAGVTGSTATAQEAPAATHSTSTSKSRAQVREELVEAQRMGLIPSGKTDYPPSPQTIARNQVRFQQAAPFWRAHGDLPSQGQLASDADPSK